MTISTPQARNGSIRYRLALQPEDQEILSQLHYTATYYPAAMRGDFVPARPLAELNPDFNRYYEDWGRPGDIGFIAGDQDTELTVGAAWCRRFKPDEQDVGGIEMADHEISIGVVPGYQRRGIGKTLLRTLMAKTAGQGVEALSLGVDYRNSRAIHLYESVGFVSLARFRDDLIMQVNLPPVQINF